MSEGVVSASSKMTRSENEKGRMNPCNNKGDIQAMNVEWECEGDLCPF